VDRYDLVIIGAGPGGYVGAIRAAQIGLSVAVVEKDKALGGTCLNRGCIPTKVLLHAADFLGRAKELQQLGISTGELSVDTAKLMKNKEQVVRRLSAGVGSLLKQNGVTVIHGVGRLQGPDTVVVQPQEGKTLKLQANAILLAPGSEPSELPDLPFDGERIVSSNEALAFPQPPARLLVVGAGAVGLELAVAWARFGSAVTVVELMPQILPGLDREVAEELASSLKSEGITIHTQTTVSGARVKKDGVSVVLRNTEGSEEQELTFDKVLVAVGRRACLEPLQLQSAGIVPEKGRVPVDRWGRTSAKGVFAAGDAVPGPQLAHLASAEAVVAVETAAGKKVPPVNRNAIPACVYTDPEVGVVGMTEQQAQEAGYRIVVSRFPFIASGKAVVEGRRKGFVKIVGDEETGQILGVHIIGPHATELIAEATLAVQLECTFEELARTIHAHPTLSEAVMEAAHGGLEGPIHFFKPRGRKP